MVFSVRFLLTHSEAGKTFLMLLRILVSEFLLCFGETVNQSLFNGDKHKCSTVLKVLYTKPTLMIFQMISLEMDVFSAL